MTPWLFCCTGKRVFQPLRVAITGCMAGPDIGAHIKLLHFADGVAEGAVPLEQRMEQLEEWVKSNSPSELQEA